MRARFPDEPGATIAFPVVQRCGTVERAWTDDGARWRRRRCYESTVAASAVPCSTGS
jgi:hypothetical protein